MRKTQTLLSALIICMTVCSSFTTPQKNDDESPVNTATSLIGAGEYRLALRTLKDCDALFADALRMEAYNGLNRTRKAIRYGVEYLDELGRQHIKDSTVSLSSYVSTEVQEVLNRNCKYASRQIQKRLAGQECNTQLQMILGSLYQKNGLYNEAIEQYDKVMDYCRSIRLKDFGTDWLCVWKSDCYYVLEDYDNAVKTISQAIEANNSRDYYQLCRRGFYYMQQGKFNEAMEDYSKAAEVNPNNAEAYFGRCAVLYRQGKLEEARDEYGKGIKIDPAMECLKHDDELMDIVTEFSKGI